MIKTKIPSFFVVGGMKSGSTTLHHYLHIHPQIYMRDDFVEHLHFFSIDDIEQNPEFFFQRNKKWHVWDYEKNFTEYNHWYLKHFHKASHNQIIGETSVSYLHSVKAAKRIFDYNPNSKIIIILRHPVKRLISQYYHQLRENRITMSIDHALQYSPGTLIKRSSYVDSLKRYFRVFDIKNVHVIIFEEFINNIPKTIDKVYDFLGVESIDISDKHAHLNQAMVPRSIRAQLLINKYARKKYSGKRYKCCVLPNSKKSNCANCELPKWLESIQNLNMKSGTLPNIKTTTQKYLECLLEKENCGLSNLLDKDFTTLWKMNI